VADATSPTIDPCPPDIATTVSAPTTSTVVTFATPAASDGCSTPTVDCNPPSGSAFPLGTNAVTCTAVDTSGNSSTCSFNVIVQQQTSPVLHDFAIVRLKAPKTVMLSAVTPVRTKRVVVQIQNLSTHPEAVSNLTVL